MGLSSAVSKVERKKTKPDCLVDLSLLNNEPEGTSLLRFREPKALDYYATPVDDAFRADYPDLAQSPPFAQQLRLLAICYVPEQGETVDPVAEFAGLARSNEDVYAYIVKQFSAAFPSADIGKTIEAKKKELAASKSSS